LKIFYRLSDGSYPKVRFDNATKENCLRNFLEYFSNEHDDFFLYLDNVKDETYDKYTGIAIDYKGAMGMHTIRTHGGSSAAGFRIVLMKALVDMKSKYDHSGEVVYFIEDDYAHLKDSRKVLLEGIKRADYVTLYNHPDKYIPASQGGNPLIGDDGAEDTKVLVTDSSYWMMTNSTTMSFATTIDILKQDKDVWLKFTEGAYPQDMQIFLELRRRGRTLIQPIPTMATHCEPAWAAHLHGTGINDWNKHLIPRKIGAEPYRHASF